MGVSDLQITRYNNKYTHNYLMINLIWFIQKMLLILSHKLQRFHLTRHNGWQQCCWLFRTSLLPTCTHAPADKGSLTGARQIDFSQIRFMLHFGLLRGSFKCTNRNKRFSGFSSEVRAFEHHLVHLALDLYTVTLVFSHIFRL